MSHAEIITYDSINKETESYMAVFPNLSDTKDPLQDHTKILRISFTKLSQLANSLDTPCGDI